MALLDTVNTITQKTIVKGVIDNVFKNSPLLASLKQSSLEPYTGGPSWQENFLYDVLDVEAYQPGATFTLAERQLVNGATVTPRFYNVAVTALIEKLKADYAGEKAVVDYLDLLLSNAALTMSARLSNDIYKYGVDASASSGSDRSIYINGLEEALNDGSTTSFSGVTGFANYLTVPRASVNNALDSPMTTPTANVGGAIQYATLEEKFSRHTFGQEMPSLIVTTNRGWSFIKEVFQPQQRFSDVDPDTGFQAIKFNGAKIMADQYCPGARAADGVDTRVGYVAVASGETIWFLNPKYMKLWVSTDPLLGFGFTGFIPSQNTSRVAGHYKFCGNFTVQAPRLSGYLFGITA